MSIEFTGERVVPGQVDADLWNEHFARYLFAARLSRNRRVLDVGCGTGYGSAELARSARSVVALDLSEEAVRAARGQFSHRGVTYLPGSATALPFAAGSFDLVVAFEVIEHLEDAAGLLTETRRVLAPGGQFVVSTPNRLFYAESRKLSGPNPFHVREWEFAEFRDMLREYFPNVCMFLEDHTQGILMQVAGNRGSTDVRFEQGPPAPETSNFFVAVCAMTAQTGAPTFIYIPSSANVLRERSLHIEKLEGELATKDAWLRDAREEHRRLVESYRQQKVEVEEKNAWAEKLNGELAKAGQRIAQLQGELEAQAEGYKAKVRELEGELASRHEWGMGLEAELRQAHAGIEHRDGVIAALEAELAKVRASRWMRLGRKMGLGPQIADETSR